MIYSLFYRHNSSSTVFWVSSFHLSVNIVVLYQFTVPGQVYRKLRIQSWSVKSLRRKKGSRLRLCFRVVDDVPEKNGMDLWKQMSSSKCSSTSFYMYLRDFFSPLTLPRLQFMLGLHFTPGPQSAVCSPQSAVFLLHWPIQENNRQVYFCNSFIVLTSVKNYYRQSV